MVCAVCSAARLSTPAPPEPLPHLYASANQLPQRLKLGGLVMGNTYRNPALVAKMATTLDQASKGRFILGLGAGLVQARARSLRLGLPLSEGAI